jgi:ferredoxin
MKAIVDEDTCIGCCLCVELCPQVFSMEQDGKAVAKDMLVPLDTEASCRDAAQQCPVEAIKITE